MPKIKMHGFLTEDGSEIWFNPKDVVTIVRVNPQLTRITFTSGLDATLRIPVERFLHAIGARP